MKRKWEKPHVNVIVRGRLEESVLGVCKKWCTGGPAVDHCRRRHHHHGNKKHGGSGSNCWCGTIGKCNTACNS